MDQNSVHFDEWRLYENVSREEVTSGIKKEWITDRVWPTFSFREGSLLENITKRIIHVVVLHIRIRFNKSFTHLNTINKVVCNNYRVTALCLQFS